MKKIENEIIGFLKENKMSTEEVSDAMGKSGLIENAKSIKSGNYCVGKIQYIYAFDDSNWPIHQQVRNLEAGKIAYVDHINVNNRALFGELVCAYMLKKKGAIAIVTNGLMRDLAGMIKNDAYVWCGGITPIGCFNKQVELSPEIIRVVEKNKEYFDDSIAVCDDSGVVVIPKEKITEEFLEKLRAMKNQEKIWFDCVLNKNWDTFDTVCLKKYLEKE